MLLELAHVFDPEVVKLECAREFSGFSRTLSPPYVYALPLHLHISEHMPAKAGISVLLT